MRVQDVYDTGIDDLWDACTRPERLARWLVTVSGDLRRGGTVDAVFSSGWAGELRVEECEAPRHLLLTSAPGTEDATTSRRGSAPKAPGRG